VTYLVGHAGYVGSLALAHIAIVIAALGTAVAIALPLGIMAARNARTSTIVLGSLGTIYTIPSLALLAVLVQIIGLGVSPLFIALVAYAQFVLVRNVATGLQGVNPQARDAGAGLGMSPRQLLWLVDLPLALPAIIGGIRIAAVAMIALATLGGYIGAGGLGTLIFTGLTLRHNDEILAGSIAVCLIAIAADLALRALERKLRTN
jgi:osmoprotectant transport system permease protein